MTPEAESAADIPWPQLSTVIADRLGLYFPPERQADLQRGMAGAAREFGFVNIAACAQWLLSGWLTKAQLNLLASHLTVGETYFFRDRKTFDVLVANVLPQLVQSRRNRGRRLRIWSAACCTGEEPYSLAILLRRFIPDYSDWNVTILGTDINERYLEKAAAGVYGEWSFRESPAWFKEEYFMRRPDGRYAISPEIKSQVTFANLNLVEDIFPSPANDTHAMDIIFCRNVLMYFTQPQAEKVISHLHRALAENGWLAVNPCETSQGSFAQFTPVNFPGVILHQKRNVRASAGRLRTPPSFSSDAPAALAAPAPFEQAVALTSAAPVVPPPPPPSVPSGSEPAPANPVSTPYTLAVNFYKQGRYAEAADILLPQFSEQTSPEPQAFSLMARALANQGALAAALEWCDRWVAADKLNASSHYLRATVLQELGDEERARHSFRRTIYLQPDFVLAHFALGNLARHSGRPQEEDKHFTNALTLLRDCPPDELLPESDGLTAGHLAEIISSITARETAA